MRNDYANVLRGAAGGAGGSRPQRPQPAPHYRHVLYGLVETHKLGPSRTGLKRVRIQNQYSKLRLRPQNLLSAVVI